MNENSSINAMNQWYKSPLGSALLKAELIGLKEILSQIFGYYIMQIGGPIENKILEASHIHQHIIVNQKIVNATDYSLPIQCQLNELPFLPESIDAIVMFHVLEFESNPKVILDEIYRTLIPGGYVVIFGFNPYSLWGIISFLKRPKDTPWFGNWIGPGRMRRWLDKIGFDIGDYKTFYFRPPSDDTEKLLALEGIGPIFWPYGGASYVIVAQKTAIGLTPIKPWSFTKYSKVAKVFPKVTSRINQCNRNQYR
jgi:SAM-dependent methyltransferase